MADKMTNSSLVLEWDNIVLQIHSDINDIMNIVGSRIEGEFDNQFRTSARVRLNEVFREIQDLRIVRCLLSVVRCKKP